MRAGEIVTAGLIDIHAHLDSPDMPPAHCLSTGVTSIVDGGSRGADNVARPGERGPARAQPHAHPAEPVAGPGWSAGEASSSTSRRPMPMPRRRAIACACRCDRRHEGAPVRQRCGRARSRGHSPRARGHRAAGPAADGPHRPDPLAAPGHPRPAAARRHRHARLRAAAQRHLRRARTRAAAGAGGPRPRRVCSTSATGGRRTSPGRWRSARSSRISCRTPSRPISPRLAGPTGCSTSRPCCRSS